MEMHRSYQQRITFKIKKQKAILSANRVWNVFEK